LFAFFLNIALMLEITSFARCPSSPMLLSAARASFRLGSSFSSQRVPACELATTAASGCLISCAMEATIAPMVASRETRAISVCPMISRARATAIPRNSFTGKCPEWDWPEVQYERIAIFRV
jgi:hypothetical protein